MIHWWQSLAKRERTMVGGGAIVIASLLIYVLILNPLNSAINYWYETTKNQQSLLSWMQQATPRILQLRRAGFSAENVSSHAEGLLILVERKLNDAQLNQYVQSIKQPNTNTLILNFHQVPFDNLILFLQDLSRHHGVQVTQLRGKKEAMAGTIDATVTF